MSRSPCKRRRHERRSGGGPRAHLAEDVHLADAYPLAGIGRCVPLRPFQAQHVWPAPLFHLALGLSSLAARRARSYRRAPRRQAHLTHPLGHVRVVKCALARAVRHAPAGAAHLHLGLHRPRRKSGYWSIGKFGGRAIGLSRAVCTQHSIGCSKGDKRQKRHFQTVEQPRRMSAAAAVLLAAMVAATSGALAEVRGAPRRPEPGTRGSRSLAIK